MALKLLTQFLKVSLKVFRNVPHYCQNKIFSGNVLRAGTIQIILNERTWQHLASYSLQLKFSATMSKSRDAACLICCHLCLPIPVVALFPSDITCGIKLPQLLCTCEVMALVTELRAATASLTHLLSY